MANNKWVEVEAKSIDDAIKAGLKELNLQDATQANINILREPEGGVFGVGGTKALVRISVRNGGSRNYNSKNKRNSGSKNGNKRQGHYFLLLFLRFLRESSCTGFCCCSSFSFLVSSFLLVSLSSSFTIKAC